MSLSVGKFFYKALADSTAVMAATSGRIFPVARNAEAEMQDHIPYVVIMPSGVSNDEGTKDSSEGQYDTENVDILAVAETYNDLVTLCELLRTTIRNAADAGLDVETWPFELESYSFSASAVSFDPLKPCYYQTLSYSCDTYNRI